MLSFPCSVYLNSNETGSQQAQNQNVHLGAGLKRQDDIAGGRKSPAFLCPCLQHGMCPDPVSCSPSGQVGSAYFHGEAVRVKVRETDLCVSVQ